VAELVNRFVVGLRKRDALGLVKFFGDGDEPPGKRDSVLMSAILLGDMKRVSNIVCRREFSLFRDYMRPHA